MKSRALLLLLAACWLLLAAASPAQEAFARDFISAMQTQYPEYKIERTGTLQLKVTSKTGREATLFLDNAFAGAQADPKARQDTINRYVKAAASTQGDGDAPLKRENILAVVKDRKWPEEMKEASLKSGSKKAPDLVYEPLNEQLIIAYVEDTPDNMAYFSVEELDKAGIKRSELRELAITNLRKQLPKLELHKGPELMMIDAGGNYETSLLLFDNMWRENKLGVAGEPVIAIPARDLLLVTGTKTPGGIKKLRETAHKAASESSYWLTEDLFVYRQGKFTRLDD